MECYYISIPLAYPLLTLRHGWVITFHINSETGLVFMLFLESWSSWSLLINKTRVNPCTNFDPDSKAHGFNMGPIWVLSVPDGPHVGPMDFAIWGVISLSPSAYTLVRSATITITNTTTWMMDLKAQCKTYEPICECDNSYSNITPIIHQHYQIHTYFMCIHIYNRGCEYKKTYMEQHL